jgi:hypothetical protein
MMVSDQFDSEESFYHSLNSFPFDIRIRLIAERALFWINHTALVLE